MDANCECIPCQANRASAECACAPCAATRAAYAKIRIDSESLRAEIDAQTEALSALAGRIRYGRPQ